MNEHTQMRQVLCRLRQDSKMSQAEVAAKLPASASASRISRIESGDIRLSTEEARDIAKAVGSLRALEYATYLDQRWLILEPPGFEHVDRKALWAAEGALQRLKELEDDPDLRNVFLKQVQSCRDALVKAACFLQGREHPIATVGSPGVGKTTLICALAHLRDESDSVEDLDKQMVLQTGGGRTTICEVHVRCGREYAITVDPCSDEEMRQFVAEFCDHLARLTSGKEPGSSEAVGLNAEIDRALRNMSGLAVKRSKGADGKLHRDDPARELATKFPNSEDLQAQVFARLELPRRRRTSIVYPRDSTLTGLRWVSRVFAQINYGRHPEFSLPRRIEVSLPDPILGEERVDLRLIDTRGVDEPKAPRRDLQAYLDDEMAIVVFCSSFRDAPDAAMLDVIERAIQGGLWEALSARAAFVVLPQHGEEMKVRDHQGEQASTVEDGRFIKEGHLRSTLARLGIPALRVEFLDVTMPEDCKQLRIALADMVLDLRRRAAERIELLVGTVDHLIANKASEQVRAAFEAAARRVSVWTSNNEIIPDGDPRVERTLLADMASLRYAASLRASVNRRGDWYNFDYWQGLGYGSRCEAVARTEKRIVELKHVLKNLLDDDDLADAHGFLRNLSFEVDEGANEFYQEMQAVGEAAFGEQLRADHDYWLRCRNRWGFGSGYKIEIRGWTDTWFSGEHRLERRCFIENELQRRWQGFLHRIRSQVESAAPTEAVAEGE